MAIIDRRYLDVIRREMVAQPDVVPDQFAGAVGAMVLVLGRVKVAANLRALADELEADEAGVWGLIERGGE
jgi:hypothetical protein